MIKRLSIMILHDDSFDGDHAPPQQDHRVTGPNGSSSLIWQQWSSCFPDSLLAWNAATPSIPLIPALRFDDTELPIDKDCASNIISSKANCQQNATQDGWSEFTVFNWALTIHFDWKCANVSLLFCDCSYLIVCPSMSWLLVVRPISHEEFQGLKGFLVTHPTDQTLSLSLFLGDLLLLKKLTISLRLRW